MNAKKIITVLLAVFVVSSLVYMFVNESETTVESEKGNGTGAVGGSSEADEDGVIVYYFHGDMRCQTCIKLESYARQALENFFADKLSSGEMAWKPVNIDKPENKHFIKRYSLVTKAVILSEVENGSEVRWKNLDLIWEKVDDKQDYIEYIKKGIRDFLDGSEE